MPLITIDHPLVEHKTSLLRDVDTKPAEFRALVREISSLLSYEACRELALKPVKTPTWTGSHGAFNRLATPSPLLVPILRAGVGMLDGALSMLPNAVVCFMGIYRDEKTAKPNVYYQNFPEDVKDRPAFVIDPMLATGGSCLVAVEKLFEKGVSDVSVISILGAPEGVRAIEKKHRSVKVFLGSLEERLDERAFIIPGLGDAGDRLFETT